MAKHWQETMFPQQCFLVCPGLNFRFPRKGFRSKRRSSRIFQVDASLASQKIKKFGNLMKLEISVASFKTGVKGGGGGGGGGGGRRNIVFLK
jgi:hypothetical protein